MEAPIIQLDNIAVQYRSPLEKISSFKEYAIRRLKGQIRYEYFWALNGVSLEIRGGEVFGIIGPNGAGKSTLLKVVARVLRPTRGRIRITGRVAPLLELGAGFDNELTGRENVYLNAAILGRSKAEIDARFHEIVAFSGLDAFIDAPLRTYSTGMVARLGFAVATDVRPDVLIVDEILGVGDAEFQEKSYERIQEFKTQGTTILLVTHSLTHVQEMCSRVMWLNRGKLVLLGSPQEVVTRYLQHNTTEEGKRLAEIQDQNIQELEEKAQEIRITDVKVTDLADEEQTIFQTGKALKIHIGYETQRPVQSPIFGVGVYRHDGVHITGPNTDFANFLLPTLSGQGTVVYTVPDLPLLNGLYEISVAIADQSYLIIYDFYARTFPFRVVNAPDGTREKYGFVTFNGYWEHHSNE
ncbi:MAG TPA: ABC transporter ATP-binding protein [Anaerolineales bacterium]|nr:ABC transporter ATP-binding protein [Anaerolineales bacterium]